MADKKYRAGNIAVNAEQMNTIQQAMAVFRQHHGITLTRSQALAWLAHEYVQRVEREKRNEP